MIKPASGLEMFITLVLTNAFFMFMGLYFLDFRTFEFWLFVGFPVALAAFGTWLHVESLRRRRDKENEEKVDTGTSPG